MLLRSVLEDLQRDDFSIFFFCAGAQSEWAQKNHAQLFLCLLCDISLEQQFTGVTSYGSCTGILAVYLLMITFS